MSNYKNEKSTENGKKLEKPIDRQRPSTGRNHCRPHLERKESKSLSDLRAAETEEPIRKLNDKRKPIDSDEFKEVSQNVQDDGARGKNGNNSDDQKRLVLLSTKIRNYSQIANAVLPNVILVQYKYDNVTLESLLHQISQTLDKQTVQSIACILHSQPGSVTICSNGDSKEVVTLSSLSDQSSIREFFCTLVKSHLDKDDVSARIDLLACNATQNTDGAVIAEQLESLTGVSVGISKEILGSDIQINRTGDGGKISVGELYFKSEKLEKWKTQPQSLAGFEKIRTVGKGAYGAAVLYRKKDDDSLVILKEINMHDLTAAERQMALNEVNVLAMLDHPNIISYYDSFEEDGTLMIEMEYADGGTLHQYLAGKQGKELEEKEILTMFQQMIAAIRHIHEHNILHSIIVINNFNLSFVCEGKPYNEKSDIWALGCILYEMACLQKTFEGSNLPALVNKIMKGQFTPVKGSYSVEFKALVRDMLQREPEYRPSANELMYARLHDLMMKYEDPGTDVDDELMTSADSGRKQRTRSVLYYFETLNMSMQPIDLPCRIKIRQGYTSSDQFPIYTALHPFLVYSGLGQFKRVCCGDGFSVFGSDNGIVMTCGDGSNGCLGHGDWSSASRPRLIEPLLSVDVTSLSCGPYHVVAVGADGEVFAWGKGQDGRLGLGNEEDYATANCPPTEVEGRKVPTVIKALSKFKVLDMILGPTHSAVIVEPGHVYTFGKNTEGQLGAGNIKPREVPVMVKDLSNKTVT
ncbi:serine/threonine-protein kinase Nek8-like, partial [Saccoglossus kowalevskii]